MFETLRKTTGRGMEQGLKPSPDMDLFFQVGTRMDFKMYFFLRLLPWTRLTRVLEKVDFHAQEARNKTYCLPREVKIQNITCHLVYVATQFAQRTILNTGPDLIVEVENVPI